MALASVAVVSPFLSSFSNLLFSFSFDRNDLNIFLNFVFLFLNSAASRRMERRGVERGAGGERRRSRRHQRIVLQQERPQPVRLPVHHLITQRHATSIYLPTPLRDAIDPTRRQSRQPVSLSFLLSHSPPPSPGL